MSRQTRLRVKIVVEIYNLLQVVNFTVLFKIANKLQ